MIGFNYLGRLGQLGNQMFQYASVMGVACGIGTSFCVPKHEQVVVDGLGNKLRVELFDVFEIPEEHVGFIPASDLQEKGFTYDPELLKLSPDTDASLVGFFQSYRYFEDVKDKVKEHFKFKQHIVDDCQELLGYFDNPIALHIRRGDYIINSANHHNLSMEYYEKALEEFDSDRQVVIFSDDPQWCMAQSLFSEDRFLVSEGNSSYHDLYLMSQCSDFIIANSTYSWWGAYLADRGKVVVPNKWFGPNNADKSTEDLYPPHWKIIPYN